MCSGVEFVLIFPVWRDVSSDSICTQKKNSPVCVCVCVCVHVHACVRACVCCFRMNLNRFNDVQLIC